jgi:hypothetical protein
MSPSNLMSMVESVSLLFITKGLAVPYRFGYLIVFSHVGR